MAEIEWNLPNEEKALDRIDELLDCLHNFPDSKLAPIWRKEIAQLEAANHLVVSDDVLAPEAEHSGRPMQIQKTPATTQQGRGDHNMNQNRGTKLVNAGYEIIQQIDLGDRHFVVGHHPKAPSSFVTWEYFAERDSYYQGHYFTEQADATLDMFRRASEDLTFEGKSLGLSLLSEDDRQELFLEFYGQSARNDIANALAEELDCQDLAYDAEKLLADPDFLKRAMHSYDRLDHGYENEALRDEIALMLSDYPQYIIPEKVPQEILIPIFPEMNKLITDLLTMQTAQVPEKYGPLGDNISFSFELGDGCTATVELVPDTDLLDQNKLSDTNPFYASLTIRDENGVEVDGEGTWGHDLFRPDSPKRHEIEFSHSKITLILQEEESLRRVGNSFRFQPNSEDQRYQIHNGEVCTIQRALTSEECDILCVGFMWEAQFPNGDILHVFDEELESVELQQSLKAPLAQQIQNAKDKTDSKVPAQSLNQKQR